MKILLQMPKISKFLAMGSSVKPEANLIDFNLSLINYQLGGFLAEKMAKIERISFLIFLSIPRPGKSLVDQVACLVGSLHKITYRLKVTQIYR